MLYTVRIAPAGAQFAPLCSVPPKKQTGMCWWLAALARHARACAACLMCEFTTFFAASAPSLVTLF